MFYARYVKHYVLVKISICVSMCGLHIVKIRGVGRYVC